MIISHKYKFIYFKAKKVAGTSTEILIGNLCGDQDIVTPIWPPVERIKGARNHKGFRNHNTPEYIKNKIGSKIFNSYFKFATVRNPFDRLVSSFFWGQKREGLDKLNKNQCIKEFRKKIKNMKLPAFINCLTVEKNLAIDDYIRYENLEEDTKRICSKWFNMDNFVFPRAKTSQRVHDYHYTEYYDEETKQIVAEKYAKDIEYFGYEFGE
tara:strand:- start:1157 stop:1786 length:630 start_codon:yes stop_codon:yes gene_type:complete